MCSRRAHWLAGLLALSFCTASPAWGQSPVVPPLASRMVSVGGHAMRVQTAGLDTRLAGQPIVVFQNGGGSSLETWGAVPARISEFAPVVVYDRNTVGGSEWDGEIGTPAHVTERLWQLLAAVGAAPPYVLVGWSWGGDLIRYHAGVHPEAVAGLVHIDPAGYSPGSELQLLAAIGSGEEALQAMEDFEGQASGTGEPDRRREAESAYMHDLFEGRIEPDYGPVPSVPVALILAGRHEYPPQDVLREAGVSEEGLPLCGLEYHEARLRDRIARLGEWALSAPAGLILVAADLGHAVHREDPELVVQVVRRILSDAAAPGSSR